MDENKIEFVEYTKIIKGNVILNNINLSLEKGGIYAFYGHNGSGKTMLLRAVAGLIHATKGEVSVFGKVIGKDIAFPMSMGLVIENVGFFPHYTGFENLKTLASIRKVIGNDEIRETLKRVGLNPDDKRTYKKYSLGMKQRLAIAQAIMEKPEIILLDEPTNGLDDDGVEKIRDIIKEEQQRGATVLLASHSYVDLKLLCSRFFKINDGDLQETAMEELK